MHLIFAKHTLKEGQRTLNYDLSNEGTSAKISLMVCPKNRTT